MSAWLLSAVTVAYIWTALDLYLHGRPGLSFAFMAYAAANIGFIWGIVKH